jgi:hypothetical protein
MNYETCETIKKEGRDKRHQVNDLMVQDLFYVVGEYLVSKMSIEEAYEMTLRIRKLKDQAFQAGMKCAGRAGLDEMKI